MMHTMQCGDKIQRMTKVFLTIGAGVVGVLLATRVGAAETATIGARTSKQPSAQTSYVAQKTDEKITIDGVLDEGAWQKAVSMPFVGIVDRSKPPFLTEAKMLWDDKYLYVGYYFESPDVRAYWGLEEANCTDAFKEAAIRNLGPFGQRAPLAYMECSIMMVDRFAKLFLDPDGDGENYFEFQCNPLNNYFDAWYKQGFAPSPRGAWGTRERFPNVEWRCPGRLSATHIYGSVNAPQDVDKGWSLEMAIPWTSIAPFTKGACPPDSGDIWGGHLGRVYRDRVGGHNEYWVWPYLGVVNCHLPDRYGKIIFKDELRHFERFFVWGSPREDEAYVKRLAQMGVTDVIGGMPTPKVVALYAKYNIHLYPIVVPGAGWGKTYPGVRIPLQKMTDTEIAVKELLNGSKSPHRPVGAVDAPPDWSVTGKQKKLLDALSRTNYKQQSKYQWGGEKERKYFGGTCEEVLTYDLPCLNAPRVREVMKERVKAALAIPGVHGVAFDFVGYQNYHACYCPICEQLYKDYCKKEQCDPADPKSRDAFSLSCLVDFNNEMVDYAHSLNPDVVVVNHVYPVFMPEPLYGNRLKVDFCGQTAAWYQYWDLWRIQKYAKVISGEQEKYWKGVKGVAFIGYYDNPEFPVKTPAKVEAELRAILRGGANYLMMCGGDDLLRNPDVCDVFKKFCLPGEAR